jgi:hypothetical protein
MISDTTGFQKMRERERRNIESKKHKKRQREEAYREKE